MQTTAQTTHALKEWQVAVEALERGETCLLLRKGGIRETGGHFHVLYDRGVLYPTFEHQQPNLLKSAYAPQVPPVVSGWHPESVRLGSWAIVTDTLQMTQPHQIAALLPLHIWNERFVTERFAWKPNQPLYVLLLRVYRLLPPLFIPYDDRYGGCKSWIELTRPIDLAETHPVLTDAEFAQQVHQIRACTRL